MEIHDADNRLSVERPDPGPESLSSTSVVELSVAVCSQKFSGHGCAWVAAEALSAFVDELRELERRRQGEATLTGLVPEEFLLRVWSIDRWGHMAIAGRITRRIFAGNGSPLLHSLEFGFEFDPSLLPRMLSGFEAIVKLRG